ncbi:hypothetical protein GW17_00028579, partial [Ensete ventricosum]
WELARSALGARRGYRDFARMTQESSPEEDRDSPEDYRGSRKACREFTEGIGKLVGNTLGDRWKKTRRLTARMQEAAGLVGVNLPYPGVRAAEPPRSVNYSYPVFPSKFDFLL